MGFHQGLHLVIHFLKKEHLSDRKCNELCRLFEKNNKVQNGVIVHSELLLDYLKNNYPEL